MKHTSQKTRLRHAERMYPVVVQEDISGGYWVSCPAFEGCYSQGKTVEEALKNVKEAIDLCRSEVAKSALRARPADVSLHFVQV